MFFLMFFFFRLILHAIDVPSINPLAELIINSSGTDVFLLLVYHQTNCATELLFVMEGEKMFAV